MNKSINIKIVISVLALVLFVVMVSPGNAFAGTHVTVYFAGGFVIGGVAVFYSVLIGGDRQHSKNEKKDNEDNPAPVMQAFNYPAKQITEDEISQAGLVKILEW